MYRIFIFLMLTANIALADDIKAMSVSPMPPVESAQNVEKVDDKTIKVTVSVDKQFNLDDIAVKRQAIQDEVNALRQNAEADAARLADAENRLSQFDEAIKMVQDYIDGKGDGKANWTDLDVLRR